MTIEELKQALEAATPGQWEIKRASNGEIINIVDGFGRTVMDPDSDHLVGPKVSFDNPSDARLIVAAVNNLPALLKAVEAAKEVLAWDSDCIREELFDGPCYGQDNWKADFDALRKAVKELNNGK